MAAVSVTAGLFHFLISDANDAFGSGAGLSAVGSCLVPENRKTHSAAAGWM